MDACTVRRVEAYKIRIKGFLYTNLPSRHTTTPRFYLLSFFRKVAISTFVRLLGAFRHYLNAACIPQMARCPPIS